jgi:uncharacterized protein with GYD domain
LPVRGFEQARAGQKNQSHGRTVMPIFITQGRYTRDSVKKMSANPEDRTAALASFFEATGGKLIGWYLTFGDYDFLVISENKDVESVAAALLAVAGKDAVADLKTMVALTASDAKKAFAKAGKLASAYRPPGKK